MKRLVIVLAALAFGSTLVGCSPDQMRDWTVPAYAAYTTWIADSPYWPADVERMTVAQKTAFAETSWTEHEVAIERGKALIDQLDQD